MNFFQNIFHKENLHVEQKEPPPVKQDFSDFHLVAEQIYNKCGITDLDKRALALKILKQMAQENKINNTTQFIEKMTNDEDFYQQVINIATVNETYFFREIKELEWLVDFIKKSQKNLDILSLPSSSGEEVYSILIMLKEVDFDLNKIKITGYDINSQSIQKAKSGVYSKHSTRNIDTKILDRYFTQKEKEFYIDTSIKNHANFYQKNIFECENETKKFDIILSRNMLIYFDTNSCEKATDIIVNLLKPNGIFIKGHADHISKQKNLKNLEFGIYSL